MRTSASRLIDGGCAVKDRGQWFGEAGVKRDGDQDQDPGDDRFFDDGVFVHLFWSPLVPLARTAFRVQCFLPFVKIFQYES